MKTIEEIKAKIEKMKDDDRMKGEPASIEINAPLALIQCTYEGFIAGLDWVLKDDTL